MDLLINHKGFTLVGKVKDLEKLFSGWPGEMTLLDFIRLSTH